MKDQHKEDLFSILRFPSISTQAEHAGDVRSCGEWLNNKLKTIGLSSELYETPGHPIVVAKNEHIEGRLNVLLYGHYDVQPVDPVELWDTDPFEPVIKDDRIWCRGATDNKGQLMSHVLGIQELTEKEGDVGVNLTILFEGEEEIGSPNLVPFIEKNKDLLKCDVIVVSDTGMVSRGQPTLGYGLRGISCCEIIVKGPSGDLHSGVYGGAVANPATAVSRIIASLHDNGGTVAIEGFYDDVIPLQDWERKMWAEIPGVSDEDIQRITGAPNTFGEEGYSSAERLWARPTAEVNGVAGGYQGEGSKTVLPAEAMAKFSFRLVPDQEPKDILAKVKAHIHSSYSEAAKKALRHAFGKEPVLIREGGSIPIIQDMKELLGSDSLMLGLALPDCQIHAPNENFYVENFVYGIEMSQQIFKELAKLKV